jgi:exopolysaccharide biosynthesis WecB/TagA/CpsF family protein
MEGMTANAARINSDAAVKLLWDAPVAMIGGLPIAVIDRARSAELMIEVALKHRGTAQHLRRQGDEERIIDTINRARPDILWLGLGAPAEQSFAIRHRDRLRGVGLIKTSGGLFDFLSGKNARAPDWMQNAGLEWAYRIYLEPRRLAGRYRMTNPHAQFLLLTRTRHADKPVWNSGQR